MAAAGAASAQSSVTLFGIVDATISHQTTSGVAHNTFLSNSGYNSSRLGFRGTEDLGGGMAASFWLEAGLNNDDGTGASTSSTNATIGAFNTTTGANAPVRSGTQGLTFNRRSTVSLSGNWGELRLGRDYVPTFWNITVFDPFGTNGVGTTIIQKAKTTTTAAPFANNGAGTVFAGNDPMAVRASNMVGYFLPPNLGGVYGQVNYAFDEVAGSNKQGRYIGARVGYGSGPFNVALAVSKAEGTDPNGSTTQPDVGDWNLGGQWDFGMAKLLAQYDRTKFKVAGVDFVAKGWLIGTLVPVGAGEIRASYSREKLEDGPRASQIALGYVHNLSKRTALYATYARISNKDDAALSIGNSLPQAVAGGRDRHSSGVDLGIRHSF
jgi:predicted porin